MKASELIGKRVFSPVGRELGYVKEVRCDRTRSRLACLVCVDTEEEEFYLPRRALIATGDVIFAGNARLPAPSGVPCCLGLPAFSAAGERLGTLQDIVLEEEPPRFLLGGAQERACDVACVLCADSAAVVYPSAREKRAALRRAATKKAPPKETQNAQPPVTATRLNAAPFDLIGRRVTKNLYDVTGAPVALAGERVTSAHLARARRSGLLLRLAMNTVR